MAMRHAGVHVSSDNHVIMIMFREKGKNLLPVFHHRTSFEVPDDNYSGAVMKALSEAKKKYKVEFAKVSVSESKSYLFEAEIPKTDEANIRDMVAAMIEEKAPVSLPQVLFAYKVVDENDEVMRLCVGVVPKNLIEESIETFSKAGIAPLTFKIEAQAVANAVIPKDSRENSIVVSVKRHKTIIAIVKNGGVFMSTTVEFGGDIFDSILRKAGHDEEMVRYLKFAENFITENHGDEVKSAITSSFIEQATLLRNYINKYYIYWLTHEATKDENHCEFGRIIMVGEEACMPGMIDFLKAGLKTKVEAGNVWTNCFDINTYIPEIPLHESFAFAEAIGLLIEHE